MKQAIIVIALVCAVVPSMAQGTVVIGANSTVAVGIEGLIVGGNTYNASFVRQTESANVGDPGNVFFSDEAAAQAAADAIALELNAASILSVIEPNLDAAFRNLYIAVAPSSGFAWAGSDVFTNSNVSNWSLHGKIQSNLGNAERSIALFEQVTNPVPEPTTLALFGLGLAGAGVARRRKRKA